MEAQQVNEKKLCGEILTAKDMKVVIMFVLPVSRASEAPSRFKNKEQVAERLGNLEKPWWEYISLRQQGDNEASSTNSPAASNTEYVPQTGTDRNEQAMSEAHMLLDLSQTMNMASVLTKYGPVSI